ncbi:hypothetical protein PENARI_c005G07550 [Penicillium arizonense]|uniref:Linalool dehydratase/isomerase domain-containing protein n=1 Tax=Penicillium arizonense TaxID=1835702 RepID=A0A1F5LQ96_PENAI|nr:hypothetical protein PENARI_c005G07550 [Penicillium arizonense]OGE55071.1 hypothetical protein PENARI_c005G07550 [Penicillium arizonense]
MYQGICVPNFPGYCSNTYRQLIAKSLSPPVLGYWKWEALWGKFTTNFDPVKEDNIMVTGFFLQAVALYTANTGDMRYTKLVSLAFGVSKGRVYDYDIHSLSNAVFMEPDGSIIPIRSGITGFTIPGLIDPGNYRTCPYSMTHAIAHTAGEFGDEQIRKKALEKLHLEMNPLVAKTGVIHWPLEKASSHTKTATVKAMLLRKEDWKSLIMRGPDETTLKGPILDQVPYPGVLVAKARSNTSHDLHLLLYPSAASEERHCFRLTLMESPQDGRTSVTIEPAVK